jgi:hypothetical protein
LDFGFWILDFGVQFDKLTVRAVTEPVEVQSNDFGFWIFPTDKSGGLKFRKKFIFSTNKLGSLQPIFSSVKSQSERTQTASAIRIGSGAARGAIRQNANVTVSLGTVLAQRLDIFK